MKELIRNVLHAASAVVPFNVAKGFIGDRLVLPFYHLVSDADVVHVKHLYRYRSVVEFRRDMEFFLKHFQPVGLHELLDHIEKGTEIRRNSFHLSFDDGLREVHDVAAPILKQMGIPATFFINSAFLDNREMFYKNKASLLAEKGHGEKRVLSVRYSERHLLDEIAQFHGVDFTQYLSTHRPYLDSDQVKKLIRDGFTIGAHSIDHPPYADIDVSEQIRQTTESVNALATKFAVPYRVFAFPFTDRGVPRQFFDEVFGHGSVQLSCGGDSFQRDLHYPRNFQRVWMEGHAMSADRKLSAEAMKFALLKLAGRAIIRR